MTKFWNFRNAETKETELIFNGPIADESWWGDEITPAMFRDELSKVKGNLTVWLNSLSDKFFSKSQIYTMLLNHSGKVYGKIDGTVAFIMALDRLSIEKQNNHPKSTPYGVLNCSKDSPAYAGKI